MGSGWYTAAGAAGAAAGAQLYEWVCCQQRKNATWTPANLARTEKRSTTLGVVTKLVFQVHKRCHSNAFFRCKHGSSCWRERREGEGVKAGLSGDG